MNDEQLLRYGRTGVFAPLVGIIGSLQAAETLKLLIGIERGLSGKLLSVNALDMNIMRSTLSKDPACRACGGTNNADIKHTDNLDIAPCASCDCHD